RVLDGMGEKYRSVIILFELEGLPGEEVARLMDARPATVWVWLHRARSQFLAGLERIERDEAKRALAGPAATGRAEGRAAWRRAATGTSYRVEAPACAAVPIARPGGERVVLLGPGRVLVDARGERPVRLEAGRLAVRGGERPVVVETAQARVTVAPRAEVAVEL